MFNLDELSNRFNLKKILGFLVFIALIVGWVWNIIKIFRRPHEGIFMKLFRILGVGVPLLGVILGFVG